MNNRSDNPSVSALMVGEFESDRPLVQGLFSKLGWRLYEAQTRSEAIECLKRNPVQVVMAESELAHAASTTQFVPWRSSRLAIRPATTLPSNPGKLFSCHGT